MDLVVGDCIAVTFNNENYERQIMLARIAQINEKSKMKRGEKRKPRRKLMDM